MASQPDAIFAVTTPAAAFLLRETHTIPIVFAQASDPVGSGFVASVARPGGNITGFTNINIGASSIGGKWLELVTQIAPAVRGWSRAGFSPQPSRLSPTWFSVENFKRILRRRLCIVERRENAFNRDLAEALVQIGREWVKLKPHELAELTRLTGKMPMPTLGLTQKNKAALRQFDDPAVLQRLLDLPRRLWAEVKREEKPHFRRRKQHSA